MDNNSLPKILLIGEVPYSENAGGTVQTMYNLFRRYPSEKILCIGEKKHKFVHNEKSYFQNFIFLNTSFFPTIRNRLGIYLNPIIEILNFIYIKYIPFRSLTRIKKFDAQIAVVSTNYILQSLFITKILDKLRIPFIIYQMDDWMINSKVSKIMNQEKLTFNLLNGSVAWMMISPELKKIIEDRYSIANKRFLIVQNPVKIDSFQTYNIETTSSNTFKVIYAGSIWGMHYDALYLLAKAIEVLKNKGIPCELIVYTYSHFWENYESQLHPLGVVYGGALPYNQVVPKLKEGNLMLVTSSFEEIYKSHSLSSVQTKLTDYMAASKCILSYGPSYSACHRFVKEWQLGYVCSEMDINHLSEYVLSIIVKGDENLSAIGNNNYDVLKNHFSEQVVCPKLYDFIEESL